MIFIFTIIKKFFKQVLSTLRAYEILLNYEKCIVRKKEVTFLGHQLSEEGISPMKGKTEAIQSFRAPTTTQEVKSFLGLAGYLMKFIPDYATMNEPLRELTKKDVTFVWKKDQQSAFDKIRQALCNPPILGYFDSSDRTIVITDASPVGLGAVLTQIDSNNRTRVICYISKSLTVVEKRYCQSEKEALAVVWALERLREYLLGIKFTVVSDYKSLKTIFTKQIVNCARIERWVLRLQGFDFLVKYGSGKENIADALSRMSITEAKPFDEETEMYINFIHSTAAVDIIEVEEATRNDAEMTLLRKAIDSDNFDDEQLKGYKTFSKEFGYSGDVIIRRDRIVIPPCLRDRMLELGHEGHPGITVMKTRLRDRCWWPGMDSQVEKFVKHCDDCRMVSQPNKPAPLVVRPFPAEPWSEIAIDFMGPLPNGKHILVVIDYYSRYLEAEFMTSITAESTVKVLRRMFVRLGNPRSITLDNGRQFCSKIFKEFCQSQKIELRHTTPYWPQANGEVERQNRSIESHLRIAYNTHKDLERELDAYLAMYYTTSHPTTGKSPAELMSNRIYRTKIPSIRDIGKSPPFTDFADRDKEKKQKRKEYADHRRGAKEPDYKVGDIVVKKNVLPTHKLAPVFDKEKFKITQIEGTNITIQSIESGVSYERNVKHLKKVEESTKEGVGSGEAASDSEEEFRGFEEEEM